MCGVAGILRFDGGTPDLAAVQRMNDALVHRGPDGEGLQALGPCALGHRRLSIIDLSKDGLQPMSFGGLWITFNGEIYNYVELRRELEALGHVFRTKTDTEVALAAYRRWGRDAFARFNGMWGLGIWDPDRRELVLSRDRFGIKPLYCYRDERRLLFASEIKAIAAADPALCRLDRTSVARFLTRPAMGHGRRTFFERIEAIDPGTSVRIRMDRSEQVQRYWTFTPPRDPRDVPAAEAAERVQALLTQAVRIRFRSDVPVGTCLSGGLDSSSIVSIAKRTLGESPDTFSVSYPQKAFDESRYIDTVNTELGLRGHTIAPDGADLFDVLERATYFQESATGGPGIFSQWKVMELAAGNVKVLLDGQGGDEVFGGYDRFLTPYVRSLIQRGLRGEAQPWIEAARAVPAIRRRTGIDPLRTLAGYAARKIGRRVAGRLPFAVGPAPQPGLLTADAAALAAPEAASMRMARVTGDALADELWNALTVTAMPPLLHYEDRNSMAFSLESRVPFLDHELVEYVFTLPGWHKIRGAVTKAVLRDAMQPVLPQVIHQRQDKLGYPTPWGPWLRAGHRDAVEDLVASKRTLDRGFIEPLAARRLVDEHVSGAADHAWPLFQLVTLELFCRRYFDGPFVPDGR